MAGKSIVGVAVSLAILGAVWITKNGACLWAFIFLPSIISSLDKGAVKGG